MKKIRGDKLIGVIIHTCMETLQGNSLYQTSKNDMFFFFSFTKSKNRRVEHVLPGRRVGTSWRRKVVAKRVGG
jgi:hypothetical protein